jgi:nitrate reductase beta subunit
MKIRAQVGMVLNLDKCIGCHTCSVTCKNVWTSRDGVEYAWFNNVETKPGIGFPKNWEDQEKWKGGWVRKPDGKLVPQTRRQAENSGQYFCQPQYAADRRLLRAVHLTTTSICKTRRKMSNTPPTARPVSVLTGKKMDKIEWGPNWEDDLAGEFEKRAQRRMRCLKAFKRRCTRPLSSTFMMYLPRLCEHCLNPTCVASCRQAASISVKTTALC